MIAKLWKKVLFIIVFIACLFNVVAKLATKVSFKDEMNAVNNYVISSQLEETTSDSKVENTTKNTNNNITKNTGNANTNKNT